jgi:N-acetylglucosaminyl-diphospho-decaprenol L-rhamnosyltransferase
MRVDFIIVAFRSRDELPGCLDSVQAEGLTDAQIVVVDNASPDDSGKVARAHRSKPRLIASETNLGFGGGCNLGAKSSDAEALFFPNPDARLEPGVARKLVAALEADPAVAVIGPRVIDPTGESRASSAGAEPSIRSSLGHFLLLARIPWIGRLFPPVYLTHGLTPCRPDWVSGAAMLVRRDRFDAIGGFDERIHMYMEDVDLCRRLRESGWQVAYEPDAVVEHVMGHSQSTDQPRRWYAAYHAYVAQRCGSLHARAASLVAALGLGLRAFAYRGHRPVNSARMARSARAAFKCAFVPPGVEVPAEEAPTA